MWTDAAIDGSVYRFGNGDVVQNGGVDLKVNTSRPYVVFIEEALKYRKKEASRTFRTLCRIDCEYLKC